MPYLYLDTNEQLKQFCEHCQQCAWIAVDTEFVRKDTFFANLSLVQIETSDKRAAIIDPLAISDLDPLWQVFSNPEVCKVFHSARQDVEVLFTTSNIMLQNVFDTQLAAILLGYGDSIGYSRLVEETLNISLEKDQTRTNWHKRPLSPSQLNYAYEDVHYLAPVYLELKARLSKTELLALEDDFQNLVAVKHYQIKPELAYEKLKKVPKLSPKQMAIVRNLAEWREQYALKHNQPRKWVLSDAHIYAMAKRPAKSVDALYKIPQLKAADIERFGQTWINLMDAVFANPDLWTDQPKQVRRPPLDDAEQMKVLSAQLIVQLIARHYKITSTNVISISNFIQIIQSPSQVLKGWRHLIIEQSVRNFLKGTHVICFEDDQFKLMPYPPKT